MADSEGTFGGNGSVVWKVDAANGKSGSVKQTPPNHMGGPVKHEGNDSSVKGENFRIVLRIPQDQTDRDVLEDTLRKAADTVHANTKPWTDDILVAIEDVQSGKKPDGRDEQITVTWRSL